MLPDLGSDILRGQWRLAAPLLVVNEATWYPFDHCPPELLLANHLVPFFYKLLKFFRELFTFGQKLNIQVQIFNILKLYHQLIVRVHHQGDINFTQHLPLALLLQQLVFQFDGLALLFLLPLQREVFTGVNCA